jgi:cobalt-zinc-cadmium efflux system membrane fusion protein
MKMKLVAAAAVATLVVLIAGGTYLMSTPHRPVSPSAPQQNRLTPGQIAFEAHAPQLSSLRVSAVTAIALPVSEPLNGRIAYDENLTARVSSPIAGRVTSLRAEPGDQARRGTVLATIDAPDMAAAEADWRKAQADETHKQLAFDRAHDLYQGEVLALKDLESAKADLAQAKAETRRTTLRMKNLNANGQEQGGYNLRAPIAGMVADRQVNPGQEVRPDLPAPLFVVSDLHHLWVIVDVPERSATMLRSGQRATIESDALPGERFDARIERVGLVLDPATRRVQVRCALSNPAMKLKPEMFVRVSFQSDAGARKAIALPNTSLFADGLYDAVFVERAPGTFARRRVRVALRGHDVSYIDEGLASGEKVVTEGAFLLNAEVASNAR